MKTLELPVLVFALLLPAGLSAQEAAPAPALAPKIVCDAPVHDFGQADNTGFIEHDFAIRNAGTLSLEIRGVHASCGCTAVKPSQNIIPPGNVASIHARLDLRGRSGPQIKSITVQSNDPETPSLALQLKGTALQPLRAEPATMFFGRVGPNDNLARTFDVISGRGPIRIVGQRTDNPRLTLTPVAAEPGGDGSIHRFRLAIDPASPEGPVNGAAFIQTDLANQPELVVSVAAYFVPAGLVPVPPAAEAIPAAEPAPPPVP